MKLLLAAAAVAAAFTGPAAAAPPYCADVSDGTGTAARACAVGTGCAVYGGGLDQVPVLAFRYCVPWP